MRKLNQKHRIYDDCYNYTPRGVRLYEKVSAFLANIYAKEPDLLGAETLVMRASSFQNVMARLDVTFSKEAKKKGRYIDKELGEISSDPKAAARRKKRKVATKA